MFRDEHETNPARKYKMIYRKDDICARTGSVWSTVSPDGLSWSSEKSIIANARHGSIEIEVLDEAVNPIQGYKRTDADADADAVIRDNIRHTLTLNGSADVSSFKGRPVSLKFYFKNFKLYSFVFQYGS